MSKPKNFLDYVPRRNRNYEYDVSDDGIVTIHIRWKGIYHKIASVFFKKPETSHVDLDKIGSFVWLSMDGQKTVEDLAAEFQAAFPEEEKPLERISQFLKILHNNQFIVYNTPLNEE